MENSLKKIIKLYNGETKRESDYGYFEHVELSENDTILRVDFQTGRKDKYYIGDEKIEIDNLRYVTKSIVINKSTSKIHFIDGRFYVNENEFDTTILELIKTDTPILIDISRESQERVNWR